jgi:hypothetical protein
MTIEQMATRLGISGTELLVLEAQEQARSLPLHYVHLRDYLGSQVLEKQNTEWAELMDSIRARRRTVSTFEAEDELYAKLKAFVATL